MIFDPTQKASGQPQLAAPPMFDPLLYQEFRPEYPPELFEPLLARMKALHTLPPWSIADLGSGTGISAASFASCCPRSSLTLVEPDAAMLRVALSAPQLSGKIREARAQTAEHSGLENDSQDVVLIGSAFHWMDRAVVAAECARILKPRGFLLIFEYQFPKAIGESPLNEWIRRQFNLRWRAPSQKPRGAFQELLEPVNAHPEFQPQESGPVRMQARLQARQLAGLVFSQSRFLHFEDTLPAAERARYRDQVLHELTREIGGKDRSLLFDFKLQYALFQWTPGRTSAPR